MLCDRIYADLPPAKGILQAKTIGRLLSHLPTDFRRRDREIIGSITRTRPDGPRAQPWSRLDLGAVFTLHRTARHEPMSLTRPDEAG
jgi:hypothetical protein